MLTRYHQDSELDILVDQNTGKSYCSIKGYARLSGKAKSTISERVSKLTSGSEILVKSAEILTTGGLKVVRLIPEEIIVKWILKDNIEVAEKLLQAGVRKYLHFLAGYEEKQPELPQHDARYHTETAMLIQDISDPGLKSLLRQQLAEELGQKQLMPGDTPRLISVDVRAKELGVSQAKINESKKKGYWSLGSVMSRNPIFPSKGKAPLGSFMVHQYEQTLMLDDFILEYFNTI